MVFRGVKLKDDPLVQKYLETSSPPLEDGYTPGDFR
jgi:hypothetical protein